MTLISSPVRSEIQTLITDAAIRNTLLSNTAILDTILKNREKYPLSYEILTNADVRSKRHFLTTCMKDAGLPLYRRGHGAGRPAIWVLPTLEVSPCQQ